MVERGGLSYPIEVIDRFTGPLQAFRNDIRQAREGVAQFRRAVRSLRQDSQAILQTARASRQLAQANRDLRSAQAAGAREAARSARELAAAEERSQRAIRSGLSTRRAILATQRAEKALQAQCIRQEQQLTNLAAARSRAEVAASRARIQSAREAVATNARAVATQRTFNRELATSEGTANRVAFTFRRLFGVLAAFTLARTAIQGFNALVSGGVRFNQQIEQSRLGLAGIFAAVGQIRDAQGNIVQGQEAFAIATTEAQRQQQLLRQESLNTVATFQELLDTFQVAVAPGLAAGLNLDEVRQLSVRVSQAAQALGVPLNQLSEEIRALLTGNIRQTTSRIAVALGLTPETIRNARQLGTLSELLQTRFQAFGTAAEQTAQTLTGTFARLRGVFQELTAAGATPLVDSLQGALQGIIDRLTSIQEIDGRQIRILNPDAIQAVTAVYQALAGIVDRVGRFLGQLDFDRVAQAAQSAGSVAVSTFDSLLTILGSLGPIISNVAQALALLAPLASALAPLLGVLLQIRIAVGAFQALGGAITGLGAAIARTVLPTSAFVALSQRGADLWQNMPTRIAAAGAAVAALAFGLRAITQAILGVSLSWQDFREIVSATVLQIITQIRGLGPLVATFLRTRFEIAVATIVAGIKNAILEIKSAFDLELGASEELSRLAARERALDQAANRSRAANVRQLANLELAEQKRIFDQQKKDADSIAGQRIQEIRDRLEAEQKAQVDLAGRLRDQDLDVGTVTGRERDLTEQERRRFETERSRLALLRQRVGLAAQVASINSQDTSQLERQLQISQARQAALVVEGTLRSRALEGELRRAQQEAQGAAQGSELRAELDQRVNRIKEEQRLIQREINTQLAQELEQQRRITIEARGPLSVEQERLRELQRRSELSARINDQELQNAQSQFDNSENPQQRAQTAQRLAEAQESAATNARIFAEQLQEAEFRQQSLVDRANQSFGGGLIAGLRNFATEFNNIFDSTLRIAEGSVQAFSNFASKSIIDALDPTKNSDDQLANFARFLQQVGNLIIQQLTQLAIARLLLAPAAPAGAAGGFGGLLGFAEGGRIPSRRSRASLAHYTHPQGLATGGRPKGLDPRDTVPIWAQPGEFMQPLKSVRFYGADVMEAIRRRALDPVALRQMVARKRSMRVRTSTGPGFVEGGSVSTPSAGASLGQSSGSNEPGVSAAILVANDQAAERLFSGGRKAFLDAIAENAPDIEGILQRNRSR